MYVYSNFYVKIRGDGRQNGSSFVKHTTCKSYTEHLQEVALGYFTQVMANKYV